MCSDMSRVSELVGLGCFMQVNAGSIMGDYGFGIRRFARKMLKRRLIHFVATDAHDLDRRKPCLSKCAEYIKKKYGESTGRRLFYDNPMCVLKDEYIRNWKED